MSTISRKSNESAIVRWRYLFAFLLTVTIAVLCVLISYWHQEKLDLMGFVIGIPASLLTSLVILYIFDKYNDKVEHIIKLGLIKVWHNRHAKERITINWLDVVCSARDLCVIMGKSNSGYCDDMKPLAEFVRKNIRKVNFKVFFLHPSLADREDLAKLDKSIAEFGKLKFDRDQLVDAETRKLLQDRFQLFTYNFSPTFSATMVDNYMVVTHYLKYTRNEDCPAYELVDLGFFFERKGGRGQLFGVYKDNLDELEKAAKEIRTENDHKEICGLTRSLLAATFAK